MHEVDIGHDISNRYESVQPVDYLVSLLFQNNGSPYQCKRSPLFDATLLLLLRRDQGLFERRVDVAGVIEHMILKGCSIII